MHKGLLSACEPRFLSASAPSRLTHSPAWTFRMASAGACGRSAAQGGKAPELQLVSLPAAAADFHGAV